MDFSKPYKIIALFANGRFSAVQFHAPDDTEPDGGVNISTNARKNEVWWAPLVSDMNDTACGHLNWAPEIELDCVQ